MPFRKAFIVRSPVLRDAFCFPSTMESGIGPRNPPRKKIFRGSRPPLGAGGGRREALALYGRVGNGAFPCLDNHQIRAVYPADDSAINLYPLPADYHHNPYALAVPEHDFSS